MVASIGTAYSKPGKWKSEAYCATPLTFNGPSIRGVLRPIGDVVGISCVVGTFRCSLASLGCQLQRVHQAAFSQLNLEAVFTLRLRIPERSVRCLTEDSFGCSRAG